MKRVDPGWVRRLAEPPEPWALGLGPRRFMPEDARRRETPIGATGASTEDHPPISTNSFQGPQGSGWGEKKCAGATRARL